MNGGPISDPTLNTITKTEIPNPLNYPDAKFMRQCINFLLMLTHNHKFTDTKLIENAQESSVLLSFSKRITIRDPRK